MKITHDSTTALMLNQKSCIKSQAKISVRLPERTKICLKTNIDTASSNGAKAQSKTYTSILTSDSLLVDKITQKNYLGTKSELDEIAKDWVELVLKQLMEKHS